MNVQEEVSMPPRDGACALMACVFVLGSLCPTVQAQTLDWIQSPLDEHWYAYTPVLTWPEAQQFAESVGGELATVETAEEDSWLFTNFPGTVVAFGGLSGSWIGLNDIAQEGTFEWSSGLQSDYSNWAFSEPNNNYTEPPGEDFVHLGIYPGNSQWNDAYPWVELPGIIEVVSDDCNHNGVPDTVEAAGGNTVQCSTLWADPLEVSVSAGGTQHLSINAGPVPLLNVYLLLGSASGTDPGVPFDGYTLPLNFDSYQLWTIGHPNAPPLGSSFGILPPSGIGSAAFTVPPGTDPSFAGITLHHAYVVWSIQGAATVEVVSNPVPLTLVP